MKKIVCFWGLIFLLCTQWCWGQNKTLVKIEDDSLCFVNPRVSIGKTNYDLTLTFLRHNVVGYSYLKMEWGDFSNPTIVDLSSATEEQLEVTGFNHVYTQQNNFPIRITLFGSGVSIDQVRDETILPDAVLHKWAINRLPNIEFSIEPVGNSENEGCLNQGTDTFRLVLKNPDYNPPKTNYKIIGTSGSPVTAEHDSIVFTPEKEEGQSGDTTLLIFVEATGTHGMEFQIEMSCPYTSDFGKQDVLKAMSTDRKRIYVYDTVDLRQIYRTTFDAPFPDTMSSNFLICAPGKPAEFLRKDDWLKKYQWLTHMSDEQRPDPLRRLDFNVNFFYTDSVQQYSHEDDIIWKDVTDSLNYVDSSMTFYHSGFYKMLITAANKCSRVDDVTGEYIRDSLWTDLIYKGNGDLDTLHRYMQVFENNGARLHYLGSDTVCRNVNDTVWFVDGNQRKYYDPRPDYKFELTRNSVLCSSSDYQALSPKIYKNGEALTGEGDFLDQAGCDSTVQQLIFKKPGNYVVKWTRTTEQCGEDGEKSQTFSFVVGDVPAIKDTLLTAFFNDPGRSRFMQMGQLRSLAHCDTFTYILPDIKNAISGNNMGVDSTAFRFQTAEVDSIIIQESGISSFAFSNFGDDTAHIRLRAHNRCGWGGQDSVTIYNYTQPRVEIWRDSIENNDTLCVNFSYSYHLVGNLPKLYADSVAFSKNKSTQIDGQDYSGTTEDMTKWFALRNKGIVKHLGEGKFQEQFRIINKATNAIRCEQVTPRMDIVVMASPDTTIFKDSVLYCSSFSELNTKQLFQMPDTVFKGVIWQWQGATITEKFPVLTFTAGHNDTLQVKTWQSKGCRVDNELVFIPKPLPDAGLPLWADNICVPDTLSDYTRFMKSGHNLGERGMIWQVYKNALTADSLLYDSRQPDGIVKLGLSTATTDTMRLVYSLQDTLPKGIWGNCEQTDTVELRYYYPRLKLKKTDTLRYSDATYNFGRMNGYLDTLNLDGGELTWNWDGNTGGPVAIDGSYSLTPEDREKDSLKFALNGTTRCGDAISDTLVVYVPHARISAHTDMVCSDIANYLLWRDDRTTGNFVDTTTLEWTILPKNGVLFGSLTNEGRGKNVCFTGNGNATFTDTIKIEVKGKFNVAEPVASVDTVVLLVNEPVKIDHGALVQTDTLLMDDNWRMDISKIKTKGFKLANYAKLKPFFISGTLESFNNSDSIIYFPGNIGSISENQKGSFKIIAEGLKGCENDTTYELNVMGLGVIMPDWKQDTVTLCSGDSVRMDSIVVLKGKDRYTRVRWSIAYQGSFNGDTTVFRAPVVSEYRTGGLGLRYTKEFWRYDSVFVSDFRGLGTTSVNMQTRIFGEPSLTVLHDRDTLCASDSEISVPVGGTAATNVWVKVTDAYQDFLRFNGRKLIDGKYIFGKNPGEIDTVIVMASLGNCKKWDEIKNDTIYLYRFDSRIKQINVQPVCEDGSRQITAELNAPYSSYYWRHDATGTLDTAGKQLQPVYSAEGYVEGAERYVTLYAQPSKAGCQIDSQRMEVTVNRLPEIKAGLVSDTVCGIVGNTVTTTLRYEAGRTDIDTVKWFVKGKATPFAERTTPDWSAVYTLNAADTTRGYVEFVALAVPKFPCEQTGIYDTVKQVLQSPPTITQKSNLFLCQGEKLGVSDIAVIENAKAVSWSIKTGGGTIVNDTFVSNESNLDVTFTIEAQGWQNCPTQSQDVNVTLKAAPLPQIQVNSNLCQKTDIEFEATVQAHQYEWVFDGNERRKFVKKTSFAFDTEGEHQVTLIQYYNHSGRGCEREVTESITVQPRPQASFNYEAQVAVGRSVTFTNTSLPETVRAQSQWWVGSTSQGVIQDLTYTFPQIIDEVNVDLIVENEYGCKDTASHLIEVVGAPQPNFEVTVDSCARTVRFTDNSLHYGSVIRWDFGDGTTSSDQNPAEKTYPELLKDSVYTVTLSLKNAADSVAFQRQVKIISALKKVDFAIQPDPADCQQTIKKEIVFDIQGHTTYAHVDWGDHTAPVVFNANAQVSMTHALKNETPDVIRDTIKLYAENQCWKDSASHFLEIYPLRVKAAIEKSGNEVCFGEENPLGFKNISKGFNMQGDDCSWSWKFEAGKPFEQQNVDSAVYAFRKPGIYDIVLSIRDHCNEDTAHVSVRVKGNDSLYFDILPQPYCSGDEITVKFRQLGASEFSDLKWYVDGYPASTGGDNSQIKNVFTVGNHFIKLTGKAEGCEDEKTRYFKVNETPKPVISLSGGPDNGCEPFEVNFRAENYGNELYPHVVWDFKNGVASSKERETVIFEEAGTYQVALTMTSDSGCVKTVEKEITVKHTPRISFDLNDSLFCTQDGSFSVELTNTSEDLADCQFEWFRAVRGGSREYLTNNLHPAVQHFENLYGPVDFVLKAVYLANGCPAEYTRQVIASDKVKASIFKDVEHVCLDNAVTFVNQSENGTKSYWDLGDGTEVNQDSFAHVYEQVGDHLVKLITENEDGCKDSMELQVTVYPLPRADFSWVKDNSVMGDYPDSLNLPKVDNGGVNFTNHSSVHPEDWGTTLYYRWNFGDTTYSVDVNPKHQFKNNGYYEVWLTATTEYGCRDSVNDIVNIEAVKGLFIPTAFAPAMPDEHMGEGNDYRGVSRFLPKGIGLHSYKIKVYDLWGTCVWSSEALENGCPAEYWDGKFNGADLPKGTYLWKVSAVFIDGSVWNGNGATEGSVMLIR